MQARREALAHFRTRLGGAGHPRTRVTDILPAGSLAGTITPDRLVETLRLGARGRRLPPDAVRRTVEMLVPPSRWARPAAGRGSPLLPRDHAGGTTAQRVPDLQAAGMDVFVDRAAIRTTSTTTAGRACARGAGCARGGRHLQLRPERASPAPGRDRGGLLPHLTELWEEGPSRLGGLHLPSAP